MTYDMPSKGEWRESGSGPVTRNGPKFDWPAFFFLRGRDPLGGLTGTLWPWARANEADWSAATEEHLVATDIKEQIGHLSCTLACIGRVCKVEWRRQNENSAAFKSRRPSSDPPAAAPLFALSVSRLAFGRGFPLLP